ncbi:hypothetical protein [Thiomicrorhabdus aquaedulcis]|uniref:hypothetical protein n=1 Tax=Thiomicrorhabdus aquaedulcis TaxID=2211106 RepID=UPI000FDCC171|nr:hypothetical protein [Thiomicrorhabdus aquaedulcis]
MSQMVDDLLQEVEQLDEITQQLDAQQHQSAQHQSTLGQAQSTIKMDAHLAALETAKTAQQAAQHSHQATEATLKVAAEQKAQVLELSEANFSWRQALRNANADIKSIKGSVAIMLTSAILFSVLSLFIIGYLLYALTQKEELYKGEVLDIIKTEGTLHQKQVTLKIDEMSAMLEVLTYEIQSLKTPNASTPHPITEPLKEDIKTDAKKQTDSTTDSKNQPKDDPTETITLALSTLQNEQKAQFKSLKLLIETLQTNQAEQKRIPKSLLNKPLYPLKQR